MYPLREFIFLITYWGYRSAWVQHPNLEPESGTFQCAVGQQGFVEPRFRV